MNTSASLFNQLSINVALVTGLSLVYSLIPYSFKKIYLQATQIGMGIIFGLTTLLCMKFPVTIVPGVIIDGKTIVIPLAGFFMGPITGLIATGFAVIYRLYLGGTGVMAGIYVLISGAFIGVGFYTIRKRNTLPRVELTLLLLGVIVSLNALLATFILPLNTALEVIQKIWLAVITVYPAGIMLVGMLFNVIETRNASVEQLAYSTNALRDSEQRYRDIFSSAPLGIFQSTLDGKILSANPALARLLGFATAEELIASVQDIGLQIYNNPGDRERLIQYVQEHGQALNIEMQVKRRDGTTFWVLCNLQAIYNDQGKFEYLAGAIQDINDRKVVERALVESESLYRKAIEVSGAVPYYQTYHLNLEAIQYEFIGAGIREVTGYDPEEFTEEIWDSLVLERHLVEELDGYSFPDAVQRVRTGQNPIWKCEYRIRHRNGDIRWVFEAAVELRDEYGTAHGSIGMFQDITARKLIHEELRESENRFRTLIEDLHVGVMLQGPQTEISLANKAALDLLGLTEDQILGRSSFDPLWSVIHEDGSPFPSDMHPVPQAIATKRPVRGVVMGVYRPMTQDRIWLWVNAEPQLDDQGNVRQVICSFSDITQRRHAEEATRISKAQLLANLDNTPNVAVQWYDREGHILYWNPASEALYGWKETEVIGKTLDKLIHTPQEQAEFMRILAEVESTGEPYGPYEAHVRHRNNKTGWVLATTFSIPMNNEQIGFVCMDVDITERKLAEEQIQKQLRRLNALHTVDMAINSGANIQITLEVLLNQAVALLNVDAADILIFNQPAQTLESGAERGFRSNATRPLHQRLGDFYAGQVINQRSRLHIQNVMEAGKHFKRMPFLMGESFVDYIGVPLIAKGQVKGVLEIFQRAPLIGNSEWFNFLEVLAGQAAIAIDNSQLLQGLQKSTMEIILAYDATIEGWSHAMDLRDKETEGHTQRVTTMTLDLARAMHIREADLIHIQRGSLLHDIGKLGVPDGILLKPGKLTDEEWQIMRQHPTFAYQMLEPISYLKNAIDIPYCHHEKWDGTGYPRGLKGEEIPLVARIFAITDVWDALTCDRPYRKAWSKEQTIAYIKEQSGSHFDPQVVEVFLKMIAKEL